jgi:hypothetical protein
MPLISKNFPGFLVENNRVVLKPDYTKNSG